MSKNTKSNSINVLNAILFLVIGISSVFVITETVNTKKQEVTNVINVVNYATR